MDFVIQWLAYLLASWRAPGRVGGDPHADQGQQP